MIKTLEDETKSMDFELNQKLQKNFDGSIDEDEENFENGKNEIEMRSDLDMVDGAKFEHLVSDYANFNEQFIHMSIK
jgi:formiminotetrahydrofolate cyclodeaminase